MKERITLIILIFINITLCYFLFLKTENIDRKPPWHPFKLNSNLTLKSIVKDGYRFDSSPCGQVQYIKQIADTIIQYEVGIDCKDYKGKHTPNMFPIDESEDEIESEKENNSKTKTLEQIIAKNKYHPWNIKDIKNCYQKINWRVYTIDLGKKIDSLSIKNFINNKGGTIIHLEKKWNTKKGGDFMVLHRDSNLYFHCSIDKKNYDGFKRENWCFQIIRTIPFLDQKLINKEKKQKLKRDNYYDIENNWH
ncbi:MAG: hypothetical protein ACPGU6_02070 [Tenacibaculum sp.]